MSYQWYFQTCVGHKKFSPFSTPVVLYNKQLPYPTCSQITTIWEKRKQEKSGICFIEGVPLDEKAYQEIKKKGKTKDRERNLAQWVSFHLLKNYCFPGHCYRSQFCVFCV